MVDVSRHMNRILEINADERWVRVAGRRGEGPAQCRAGRTRPVLPAGTLHLQPRHDRRHDQHGCQRPGLLPLRQDARPCAGADDRAAGRHGLDIASAGGRGAAAKFSGEPTASAPSTGWSTRSSASRPDLIAAAFPEAEPLPDRLRPRAYPRRSRALQPELDPLRQRRHARLPRRGQAERGADPQAQRPGQRALRQLRRGAARCPGADPDSARPRSRRWIPGCSAWRRRTSSGTACGSTSPKTTASARTGVNLVEFVGDTEAEVEAPLHRMTAALERAGPTRGRRGFTRRPRRGGGGRDLGDAQEVGRPARQHAGRQAADRLRRGHGGPAGAPGRLHRRVPRRCSTRAGWTTACSAMSMPACCTSARRST